MRNVEYINISQNPYLNATIDKTDYPVFSLYEWRLHTQDGQNFAVCCGDTDETLIIPMAQKILDLPHDSPRTYQYRNGDTLDCRRANLVLDRDLKAEALIQKELKALYKRGPKGYHWDQKRGKYFAVIYVDDERIHLGSFDSPIAARNAWKDAKMKYGLERTEARNQRVLTDTIPRPYSILRRPHAPTPDAQQADPPASLFPNLTNTPPMPPGVFAGVDDTEPVPDDLRKPTTEQATTGKRLFPNLNEPKK